MTTTARWAIALALVAVLIVISKTPTLGGLAAAQTRTPFVVTRLYTGPDGQTHSEDIEVKFSGAGGGVSGLLPVTGAELHRGLPGTVNDWHVGPRRQYVITLSGHGELEIAGGKKIPVGPGHIELIEDTTGKGHITKVIGNEDRVTLWLPLVDQSAR